MQNYLDWDELKEYINNEIVIYIRLYPGDNGYRSVTVKLEYIDDEKVKIFGWQGERKDYGDEWFAKRKNIFENAVT